ncbi:MAG: DUF4185 domain-containing protein [Actinomycetota bacterium]|nr:DUF4185 domain-containing protein [Actinomycetota bacterium]
MAAHRTQIGAAVAALSATTLAVAVSAAAPGAAQTAVGQANPVALITGAKSINATEERYDIKGTDLGIMWTDDRGRILAAFGDTFDRPGHAKELLPSLKKEGVETTKIPTGGINIDGRNYLAYMSVRKFTEPGQWITNFSGVAYSDDGGQTWKDAPGARRPNSAALDNTFQMIAYARGDGYIYAFGTPNGRFGDAYLARIRADQLLDNSAYEYWTGHGWERGSSTIATPIVQGPVGELSVRFDKMLNSWEMMYLDESRKAIVLRLAPHPTGPWSAEIPVATANEYPDLYGGFLNPDSNGSDLYFTMTQYKTYNVMMMHAKIPASVLRVAKH